MRNRFTRELRYGALLIMSVGMLGCLLRAPPEDGVDAGANPGGRNVCIANGWVCNGDNLSRCNASGTNWDLVSSCSPGRCDASAGKCLSDIQDCAGDYSVSDVRSLNEIRDCKSISGKLRINFRSGISETEFADATQYLERVRGWVQIIADNAAYDLTFPKLSEVGALTFSRLVKVNMPSLLTIGPGRTDLPGDAVLSIGDYRREGVEFPRLQRIKGSFAIQESDILRRVSLPSLTTVDGVFFVGGLSRLVDLSVPRLVAVGSTLSIGAVPCLPYTRVSSLLSLGVDPRASRIGCCYKNSNPAQAFECDGNNAPTCTPSSCN